MSIYLPYMYPATIKNDFTLFPSCTNVTWLRYNQLCVIITVMEDWLQHSSFIVLLDGSRHLHLHLHLQGHLRFSFYATESYFQCLSFYP